VPRQLSAILKLSNFQWDLTIKVEDFEMEVCSEVMSQRSGYFAALLAHPMEEQATRTVDLTQACRERSILAADIKWLVESTEKGQALPIPEDHGGAKGHRPGTSPSSAPPATSVRLSGLPVALRSHARSRQRARKTKGT
jgi:hypothetical protein